MLKHPKEAFHSNFVSLDCDQGSMVTQHGKPMFTQVSNPEGCGTPGYLGLISSLPTCTHSCSPGRHNGNGKNKKGKQACYSIQQTFISFVYDILGAPKLNSEQEPALIKLVADRCITGCVGKGQGFVMLSYCVNV